MNDQKGMGKYIAEFIGTFFLVFMSCGMIILTKTMPGVFSALSIPFVFGGIVCVMIYATGHISGAHFNPAVTLAFFISKNFPLKFVPGYLTAQFTGALFASFLHTLIFGYEGHNFGYTGFLEGYLYTAIGMEFILSFLLMFVIKSVATDSRAVGELAGLAIGLTVALCALVGGPLCGASMNPARSLAPALMSGQLQALWLYLLVPIAGTITGALVYKSIKCAKDSDPGCC